MKLKCEMLPTGLNELSYIHYIAKSIGTPSNEQVWLL